MIWPICCFCFLSRKCQVSRQGAKHNGCANKWFKSPPSADSAHWGEQPPIHHIETGWTRTEGGGERKRKRRERVLWWSQCLPSNSSKYEDGEIMAHTAQDDWTTATMNSLLLRCILTEKRNKKERKKNWSRENLDSKGSLMPFGYVQPFFSILIY